MKKIGITGQAGFVGSHLFNTLGLLPEQYECVPFDKAYFDDMDALDRWVSTCDVIVHLAGMNRHEDANVIYQTNIALAQKLVDSFERTARKPHVLFSSSSQESTDNLYGQSKKEARNILAKWAKTNGAVFHGLIVPNVFGPFGKPYYNSFIATFCHRLTHGEEPVVQQDLEVRLIYVGELVACIREAIESIQTVEELVIGYTASYKVSEVLTILQRFKTSYFDKGEIPVLNNTFEHQLFNTFRCYMDIKTHYPVKFKQHTDLRGSFVEVARLGIGGQCSFSTTVPGITRGNHFHTRKIERFAVIKGKALIQLRKVDSDEVYDYYLDGNEPSYVDMPIWYTHNITNIGDEDLYTIFWIDEAYNPDDSDTYISVV